MFDELKPAYLTFYLAHIVFLVSTGRGYEYRIDLFLHLG